jgi:hypothetical protein
LKIAIKIVLLLLMATYLLTAQTAIFPPGSGTSSDPYKIATLQNLRWLSQADSVWDDNAYFIQTEDIDAGDADTWSKTGFSPIGNNYKPFQGHYNGNGHVIKKLHIILSQDYIGLFGYTKNATIDSIGLPDISISGANYVGGLVGYNSSSTISGSYVTGAILNVNGDVGGLVGVNDHSIIANSYAIVNVTGKFTLGGLIGHNKTSSNVINSTASGDVYGTNTIGGLIGKNDSSTVSYSSAAGNISGTQAFVGGLIGANYRSKVSNSYATGIVSGTNVDIGGLIGGNRESSTVINTYATGSVSGLGGVGGLVGINEYNSSISNSYSIGRVSASSEFGGFVGINYTSKITSCYWNTETSRITTGIGNDYGNNQIVNALTKTQMMQKNSFVSWNFDSIWSINEGTSYPSLISVNEPTAVNNFTPFTTNGESLKNAPSLTIKSENPMSNISGKVTFSIRTSGPSDLHLRICTITGKLLYQKQINSNSYEENVNMTWNLQNNRGQRAGNSVYLISVKVQNRTNGSTHLLAAKMIR